MPDVKDRVALITGGAKGIGAATAELFAERGAQVVIADLDEQAGVALATKLGPRHLYVKLDVTSAENWRNSLAEVASKAGGLDILLLNAGVMTRPPGAPIMNDPIEWMTVPAFEKVVAVNIAGVHHGIIAAIEHMAHRPDATIIVTASGAGVTPYGRDPVYAMSKYAVVGLASSLAEPLTSRGIRILTVCPNGIETTMCPPDLAERKQRENSFSTPRFMAEATVEIFERGLSGEVWMGGMNRPPFRYDATPIPKH